MKRRHSQDPIEKRLESEGESTIRSQGVSCHAAGGACPAPARLSDAEVAARLDALADWSLQDGRLHRVYSFKDFVQAFGFMTRVALVAESMDHHPDWSNAYKTVVVDLVTHSAGGITDKDFCLAEAMEKLL